MMKTTTTPTSGSGYPEVIKKYNMKQPPTSRGSFDADDASSTTSDLEISQLDDNPHRHHDGGANDEAEEAQHEVKQLAQKDTLGMNITKLFLSMIILGTGIGFSIATYKILRKEEVNSFGQTVRV